MRIHTLFKASLLALSLIASPSFIYSSITPGKEAESHHDAYQIIHAAELKSWIDSGKTIQIIDARPKKFDDGAVIKGAVFLPYDSKNDLIAKILPSKDSVIVVYCASIKCPASGNLAEKLHALGYKNLYKYPEGIADWIDKKYPTSQVK